MITQQITVTAQAVAVAPGKSTHPRETVKLTKAASVSVASIASNVSSAGKLSVRDTNVRLTSSSSRRYFPQWRSKERQYVPPIFTSFLCSTSPDSREAD